MDDKVLVHHGTKGMKWGVRRYQNPDGSLTPAGKKRYGSLDEVSDDYKKHHTYKKISSMSDKELRERLNRLDNEERYTKATETGGQRFWKKTKQAASDVMWNAGKQIATNLIVKYATKGAEKGIDALFERGQAKQRSALRSVSDEDMTAFIKRAKLEESYLKYKSGR